METAWQLEQRQAAGCCRKSQARSPRAAQLPRPSLIFCEGDTSCRRVQNSRTPLLANGIARFAGRKYSAPARALTAPNHHTGKVYKAPARCGTCNAIVRPCRGPTSTAAPLLTRRRRHPSLCGFASPLNGVSYAQTMRIGVCSAQAGVHAKHERHQIEQIRAGMVGLPESTGALGDAYGASQHHAEGLGGRPHWISAAPHSRHLPLAPLCRHGRSKTPSLKQRGRPSRRLLAAPPPVHPDPPVWKGGSRFGKGGCQMHPDLLVRG